MVSVTAWKDADRLIITGHGLVLKEEYQLTDDVRIIPDVPNLDRSQLSKLKSIKDEAAITTMHEIASFAIEVKDARGGKHLANRGWNRLWDFHLLSLAAKSPAFILYTTSKGQFGTSYSVANRNLILSPLQELKKLTSSQLDWAREYEPSFRILIGDRQFSSAMRYFGNAHYLFDLQHRIMLLWAGIEGLFKIEAEHSHRIALYSAVLSHGDPDEKRKRFDAVKQAYATRSRVVHGAQLKEEKLNAGYIEATQLLAGLLARCVELGRVPARDELDQSALRAVLE